MHLQVFFLTFYLTLQFDGHLVVPVGWGFCLRRLAIFDIEFVLKSEIVG